MPNTFETSSLIAQAGLEQLVISTPILEFAGNIGESTWTDSNYKPGQTINIPDVNYFTATQGNVATDQDIVEASVPVTVSPIISVMIQYDSIEELLEMPGSSSKNPKLSDSWKQRILVPAINSLRTQLERNIMADMAVSFNKTVGSANTSISGLSSLEPVRTAYSRMEVDEDNLSLIVSPESYGSLSTGLSTLYNTGFTNSIINKLNIPEVYGLGMLKSNFVEKHTYGTCVTDTLTVLATGAESATSVIVTGATGTNTIKAGDRFTIDGVYELTPSTKVNYGKLKTFTAASDAVASDSNVTLNLSVALIATGPRANISAQPQAGAAITFLAATESGDHFHTANFAITPNSLTLSTLNLPMLDVKDCSIMNDPTSQMSMRVSRQGDVSNSVNRFRLDILPVFNSFANRGAVLLS